MVICIYTGRKRNHNNLFSIFYLKKLIKKLNVKFTQKGKINIKLKINYIK